MESRTETIDEFESMFRRAEREPFEYRPIDFERAALVTAGSLGEAEALRGRLEEFVPALQRAGWSLLARDDYHNVQELIERLESIAPDLVVTYRHLQEESLIPQHSLGVYLDVMTQVLTPPVLVLPGTAAHPRPLENPLCRRVMVVTDHIAGDDRLINHGVAMSCPGGEAWLCHVEDDAVFERYMHAIERIPEIDTETARDALDRQLLSEARRFLDTCIRQLREKVPGVEFRASVTRGHRVQEFMQLVASQNADLLVANTKDEDQLAMHGIAYAISVEMVDRSLLLL